MSNVKQIFNRKAVKLRRNRAALVNSHYEDDFLHTRAAEILAEKLEGMLNEKNIIINSGSRLGKLSELLQQQYKNACIIEADISENMVKKLNGNHRALVCDEEYLPFKAKSVDAMVSCLNLHWINDLPGVLRQCQQALKPGGLFMASILGGGTLSELRHAIAAASAEGNARMVPRISPVIDTKAAGQLLQRAGMVEVVTDAVVIEVEYKTASDLIEDLNKMGETNKLAEGPEGFIGKQELKAIIEKYDQIYSNKHGKIQATFEIITMTGWEKD